MLASITISNYYGVSSLLLIGFVVSNFCSFMCGIEYKKNKRGAK